MKILGIIFLALYVWVFIFGKIKINNIRTYNVWYKLIGSFIFASIYTIVIGLPILGVIKILGF